MTLGLGATGFGLSGSELNNINAASVVFNASPVTVDGAVNITSMGSFTLNATSLEVNNNFATSGALSLFTVDDVKVQGANLSAGGALQITARDLIVDGSTAGAMLASNGNMDLQLQRDLKLLTGAGSAGVDSGAGLLGITAAQIQLGAGQVK